MAEDTHVIRGINWRETFPFTHIFRSFRVAIHPSKLILALLAILLLYVGGRVLDRLWPVKSRGVPNEIAIYEAARAARMSMSEPMGREQRNPLLGGLEAGGAAPGLPMPPQAVEAPEVRNFFAMRRAARDAIEAQYAAGLIQSKLKPDEIHEITPEQAKDAAAKVEYTGFAKWKIETERDVKAQSARLRYELEHDAAKAGVLPAVEVAIEQNPAAVDASADAKARSDATDKVKKAQDDAIKAVKQETRDERKKSFDFKAQQDRYEAVVQRAYVEAQNELAVVRNVQGQGLWMLFLDYEINRINDVVRGVTKNNWFGGLTDAGESGVFDSIYRFFCIGPRWAFSAHWFYFILVGILFLIVWAICGGAIARIAAVHVAREEKLSIRQALRFSSAKFLSFVFAPVIPIAIVVIVGLVVAVGGLLINVPYVGEILVGIFFFLALAAGFVMTLVALGTFGGLNLMYPTVAVEGSDSFDAISRSFSYVYARPWRMLWYSVVAIIYGALTFLFVRLFIFLTLAFTHKFAGLWVWRRTDAETSVWNTIWPGSGFWHLPYAPDYTALNFGSKVAAFFVAVWVFLVIAFLGAYLISYYFSASTIIYYLMRREVDATELDDVYLEQSDDEFAEPVATTTTTTTAVVTTTTVPAAPATAAGTAEPSMPVAPPAEPAPPPPPAPPAEGSNNPPA